MRAAIMLLCFFQLFKDASTLYNVYIAIYEKYVQQLLTYIAIYDNIVL
jgi:hypothetical protein